MEPSDSREQAAQNASSADERATGPVDLVDGSSVPPASPPVSDVPRPYWTVRAPDPEPPGGRIGWLVIGIGVVAEALLAQYFASRNAGVKPPGAAWNDVALMIGGGLAAMSGVATGCLIVGVAMLRLVDLSTDRAVRAVGLGAIGGPVLFTIVLVLASNTADMSLILRDMTFLYLVPTLCGIGVTLVSATVRGPTR